MSGGRDETIKVKPVEMAAKSSNCFQKYKNWVLRSRRILRFDALPILIKFITSKSWLCLLRSVFLFTHTQGGKQALRFPWQFLTLTVFNLDLGKYKVIFKQNNKNAFHKVRSYRVVFAFDFPLKHSQVPAGYVLLKNPALAYPADPTGPCLSPK